MAMVKKAQPKVITISPGKTCVKCKAVYQGEKPPPGWKLMTKPMPDRTIVQALYCKKCKATDNVCLAVEFPVLCPLGVMEGNTNTHREITWREFDLRVSSLLRHSRMLANWGASVLFAQDSAPDPTRKEKLPAINVDLYKHCKEADPHQPAYPHRDAWKGCATSMGCIVRSVQSAYAKHRFSILCSGGRSLPSYRSMPYPIRNDLIGKSVREIDFGPTVLRPRKDRKTCETPTQFAVRVSETDNTAIVVGIPFPAITVKRSDLDPQSRLQSKPKPGPRPKKGKKSAKKKPAEQKSVVNRQGRVVDPQEEMVTLPACTIELILDAKRGFYRQVKKVRQILSGVATIGDAAIYRKRASTGSHRHVTQERMASQRQPMRTFVKLVGYFPREIPSQGRTGVLTIYTDPNSFWVATLNGEDVWVENGDHIRGKINRFIKRKIENHGLYLDRIKQDMKQERRHTRRHILLDYMLDHMSKKCEKLNNQVNTFVDQSIAAIVSLVNRYNVAGVVYTDVCQDYFSSFRWFIFRERLKSRLPAGVTWIHTNAKEEEEEPSEVD